MASPAQFGSTLWALVEEARDGDRRALDRLSLLYRPPIVGFAVRQGLTADEAEDAAQEVLLRLLRALGSADPTKGKFRSLVLGITRNVVHEILRKRGAVEPVAAEESLSEREESFDRGWVQNIVLMVLDFLKKECEASGMPFYAALREQMDGADHDEIARKLGVEPRQVKSYIYQAREKLRRNVETAIAEYTTAHEYEEERQYLLRLLDG